MTRFFAAAAISISLSTFFSICFSVSFLVSLAFVTSLPAYSQSDRDSSPDSQCFPWQELRDGQCAGKPTSTLPPPSPAPSPLVSDPCGLRNLSGGGQCKCPAGTHPDAAGGTCVTDVIPASKPNDNIVCDGGKPSGGICLCPAGFNLMPAGGNAARGGTCIKTHAENCLGGELTVSGTCLCNGQVIMSGETYGLEYVGGKCLPKRCPVQTMLKDGKCIATPTTASVPETETKTNPASPKALTKPAPKEADDEEEHRRHCAHGMVRTHSGCVSARRRYPSGVYGGVPAVLRRYYRTYRFPG